MVLYAFNALKIWRFVFFLILRRILTLNIGLYEKDLFAVGVVPIVCDYIVW